MESKTKSKIALGLILGVAAGAAVYYFMTNENGKEQFADVIDAVKDFSDKAMKTAKQQSKSLTEQASRLSSDMISKASTLSEQLARRAADISSEVERSVKA
ncbi:MAG: YtxH domain-containing protein [Pelobium sp.]